MTKLFLPGFLGLSMLLLAGPGTAQACVVDGRLVSPPWTDRSITPEVIEKPTQPKIAFRTDGNDVIASIQVIANNSPHALWTVHEMSAQQVVTLRYCLIQNADRLVRSIKTVTVEWRLKDFAVLPSPLLTYRVEGFSMTPNSQELKGLIPQLQTAPDCTQDPPSGAAKTQIPASPPRIPN
jgi:hypothetical protein